MNLRRELAAEGFRIWQDIVALQGHSDWWSQIEHAIRSKEVEHFVLIVTPGALESLVVQREIRLARQEGKTISPVKGPGIDLLSKLPRWLGTVYDLDIPERWKNFLAVLESQSSAARVPMMAERPPPDFVARPVELNAIKKQLLDAETGDAVPTTAILRGPSGYGKTTLAKAIAYDPDVESAYFDGILWADLGVNRDDRILALLCELASLLTGNARTFVTLEAARTAFAEALGDRRILFVLDDVQSRHELEPFLHGGPRTSRIMTTRFDREVPDWAFRQPIDEMQQAEALSLIGSGLRPTELEQSGRAVGALSVRVGRWAQALKLANGFLRDRVIKRKQKLPIAIDDLQRRLDRHGLSALDEAQADNYQSRHRSITTIFKINLDLLDDNERARFCELAVFPQAEVPIEIARRLWAKTGKQEALESEDILVRLHDLSLLQLVDFDRRVFRLHDTTREFLLGKASRVGKIQQHLDVVASMADIPEAAGASVSEKNYFYQHLPYHLHQAQQNEILDALLRDPGWIQEKLLWIGINGTIADYAKYGSSPLAKQIGDILDLLKYVLSKQPYQLIPQLLGRINPEEAEGAQELAAKCRKFVMPFDLVPKLPTFYGPGVEIARMGGHSDSIAALELLAQGQAISGDQDGGLLVWDLVNKSQLARLQPYANSVSDIAVLGSDRVAVAYFDGTCVALRLPDGEVQRKVKAHEGAINSITAVDPSGFITVGDDGFVRRWSADSGDLLWEIEYPGNALAMLDKARLIVGGLDRKAVGGKISGNALIDVVSGNIASRFSGQKGSVSDICICPDGTFLTASDDGVIRQWERTSEWPLREFDIGRWVRTLSEPSAEHHLGSEILRMGLLPNGCFVCSLIDGIVLIGDYKTGNILSAFEPGDTVTTDFAPLSDGNFLTASGDGGGTLVRFWNTGRLIEEGLVSSEYSTALEELWEGSLDLNLPPLSDADIKVAERHHEDEVTDVQGIGEHHFLSCSWDHSVRLFRKGRDEELARFDGDVGFTGIRPLATGNEFLARDARDRIHVFMVPGLL